MKRFDDSSERGTVSTLVKQCDEITTAEFVDAPPIPYAALAVWRKIARYDCEPFDRCNLEGNELFKWASDILGPTIERGSCLISLGQFGYLPWLAVSLSNANGLAELWAKSSIREIVCANPQGTLVRAISEEEYDYLAFELVNSDLH